MRNIPVMASGAINSSSCIERWGFGGLCGVVFFAKNGGSGMISSCHSISTRHWWGFGSDGRFEFEWSKFRTTWRTAWESRTNVEDEDGLHRLMHALGVPLSFLSPARLQAVQVKAGLIKFGSHRKRRLKK